MIRALVFLLIDSIKNGGITQLGWRVELFDRQYYLKSHKYLELEDKTGLIVVVYMN